MQWNNHFLIILNHQFAPNLADVHFIPAHNVYAHYNSVRLNLIFLGKYQHLFNSNSGEQSSHNLDRIHTPVFCCCALCLTIIASILVGMECINWSHSSGEIPAHTSPITSFNYPKLPHRCFCNLRLRSGELVGHGSTVMFFLAFIFWWFLNCTRESDRAGKWNLHL